MIPVRKKKEPSAFDVAVRSKGRSWNRKGRPPAHWSACRDDLAAAFKNRCGWLAMWDLSGTVDHYLSVKARPDLAYEWKNYRYATGWLNCCKQNVDEEVLDPFEVKDGWFECILPSLQVRLTEKVPANKRKRAQQTLDRLGIGHGERAIRQRRAWLEQYESGGLPLNNLADYAPLIAEAIERRDSGTSR